MKIPLILSAVLAAATLAFSSCSDSEPSTPPQPDPDPVIPVKETGFARGADVSWLTQMESEGLRFYTPAPERREMELMALLRDYCGVNSIQFACAYGSIPPTAGIRPTTSSRKRAAPKHSACAR